jgi:flagella basal body P-ring formation protein FlgA
MKARTGLAVLALGLILGMAATESRADDGGPSVRAELALRERLERAYPTVRRWEIELLPAAEKTTDTNTDGTRPSVIVTRVGERSAVWVGSKTLGEHRNGGLLWFRVAGYAPAVTAARMLTAGTQLDTRDGELLESNIVGDDCRPLEDAAALAGMRIRRMVHAGEMICANLLEPVPPVARGEAVTLLYTGRSFSLSAQGVAQADGLMGKRVTVRNVSSGDIFTATVTGKGEVSVDE